MSNREEWSTRRSCQAGKEDICQELMKAHESFLALLERKLSSSSTVEGLREKLRKAASRLLKQYNKEVEKFTGEVASFLCDLDDRKHDEETVRYVIGVFPDALKTRDAFGNLPIQSLLSESAHGYSFAPLLATEGMRLKVFTEEERGGLLLDTDHNSEQFDNIMSAYLFSDSRDVLPERLGIEDQEYHDRSLNKSDVEFQALVTQTDAEIDEKRTTILRRLFELNIIRTKDIIELEMINSCARNSSRERLDFLLTLCPESLAYRDPNDENLLLIEKCARLVKTGYIEPFRNILKVGMKYFPTKLGFLFHKNPESGKRPIEIAMSEPLSDEDDNFTYREIFQWIQEAIPASNEDDILHDVIRVAPTYFSLFWRYYPDAIFLRDKKGRLPLHIALQKAPKWSHPLLTLININNPIDRHEMDPVTGLYPFMSAASGKKSDLQVIYYLLRRDPNAWEGFRVHP